MRYSKDLKSGDIVVFNIISNIYNRKIPIDGIVTGVCEEIEIVYVMYQYGYSCEHDAINFADMLAVHNPEGEWMQFDNISGKSELLEGGRKYAERLGEKWNNKFSSSTFPLYHKNEYL